MKKIDVFISRKSGDAKIAKELYDYLSGQGLLVFDSDHTLKETGDADYTKTINEALVSATHLVVVASSVANINSSWVEAEWMFFLNRKRSGKASGNLFTVAAADMPLQDIPPALANYEVIPFHKRNFPIIYNYVRQPGSPAKPTPRNPFPAARQNKYLRVFILILLAGILSVVLYIRSQPYDITIFLKPDPSLKLHSEYPDFKGGVLSVYVHNKEERKQIPENGEVVFKQLPASSKNENVAIRMDATFWKLSLDSIILKKIITLNVVPDGHLGLITGNIRTRDGAGIEAVNITIDNDTTVTAGKSGIFNIEVPIRFQKAQYTLYFEKSGYEAVQETYYPEAGNIDIRMTPRSAEH